ncbi:MAG TPA: hypothetical protein VEL74_08400 [Thermoanaerobaculia bacterium]|nr:hypothetical protein [Thermoanaerobaculia bacterium]
MDAVADPECAIGGGPLDPRSFLGILSGLSNEDDGESGATLLLLLLRPRWGEAAPRRELDGRLAVRLREELDVRYELGRLDDGGLGLLLRTPDEPEAAASILRRVREAAVDVAAPAAGLGIGVAVYPRDGRTGEALLETASRSLWLFERLTREVWPWPEASCAAAAPRPRISDGSDGKEENHDFTA